MASLSDMMADRYGKKGEAKEEAAEGSSEEGPKLGSKLSSAIKSGDGDMIYNAYMALHAYCNANSDS